MFKGEEQTALRHESSFAISDLCGLQQALHGSSSLFVIHLSGSGLL